MLDIKLIRENPDIVRKDLEKRDDKEAQDRLNQLIELDKEHRSLIKDTDNLRKRRNEITAQVSQLKKEKKDASGQIEEAQKVSSQIKESEEKIVGIENAMDIILKRLPNILHETVPVGEDEEDNVAIYEFGEKKDYGFELKDHETIGIGLDGIDIERAAKISGARFYFLKGDIALLEQAIIRYGIDFMLKRGYTLVIPPYMMRLKPYEGVTDIETFEEALYKVENEDLYLISTSEHPLTAQYMDETVLENDLPIKLVGMSPCFRREAGSHGKDTKGIFRVHQFHKIEQVVISKPEDSWDVHEELRENAEEFFKSLEIPFRTVNICTGDIGVVAAKKYDLESWMPYQKKYREMVSCSNCTDYQSRRLNIKYREMEGKPPKGLTHTLNSTLTTDRTLVAIMENFQQEDGSIVIPKVLRPYMNGKEVLKPKA